MAVFATASFAQKPISDEDVFVNTVLAITIKVVFIALALIGISNLALAIFADVGVTLIAILYSLKLATFDLKNI